MTRPDAPATKPGGSLRLIDHPDMRESLICAVADGLPLGTAWRMAGLAREGYREWLHAAATGTWRDGSKVTVRAQAIVNDFVARCEQARATHEAALLQRIIEAGQRENVKTGQLDWRANTWILNNHPGFRQTYHEHKELHTTNGPSSTNKPPSLKDKSDAEIIELIGGEWRELLGEEETDDADPHSE